jgi:hypothetical protein
MVRNRTAEKSGSFQISPAYIDRLAEEMFKKVKEAADEAEPVSQDSATS